MTYTSFSLREEMTLAKKQIERAENHLVRSDYDFRWKRGELSQAELRDYAHMVLASRLLRIKFWQTPHLTTIELAQVLKAGSANTLTAVMTRRATVSDTMLRLLDSSLDREEAKMGLETIDQPLPSFPG